jgi:predicted nuclease of restriction endonuclease-like (RecB) superfamily
MKYTELIKSIGLASDQLLGRAAAVVNQALVLRNWLVGAWIVEYEQGGKDRAKYGARLLETMAADLTARGLKGLDLRSLRDCRGLSQMYPQIRGTVSPELEARMTAAGAVRAITAQSLSRDAYSSIPATLPPESALPIRGTVPPELPTPLTAAAVLKLSWSQLQELIRLDDHWKRAFYENECLQAHWSVRQLQRQIGSLLYERTGLSKNKKAVIERARRQEPAETIADVLRDPYILEFTGLADLPAYSEDDLESALLDHLQRFLLELGTGFCFEARQFRMTEGRRHHRVDLVLYHRRLRCHVLIDLKIRAFQPADAGQMNFYVNWFKANMQAEGDLPPVGILLCSDRDGTEVEFATAGMDNTLFVSRYLTALPSAEQLQRFLERDRNEIESLMPSASLKKPAAKASRKPARTQKAKSNPS